MSQDPNRPLDASLEAEIEAALGDMSVEDMLGYDERPAAPRAGSGSGGREFRTGTVVSVHGDDVLVEFGPKSQGSCPLSQFQEKPAIGARLEFVVERFDRSQGLLMLSREGAVRKAAWDSLEEGMVIEAMVTGTNKGGLDLEVSGHRAFMPAGQVDVHHVEDLAVFVGEKVQCEVIELDRSRNRLVLSRRAILEQERARAREQLMDTLEVGTTLEGTVRKVMDFGAFVDIGGMDGLVHVSDLSWERVKHPSEVVKEGDTVTVKLLKVDTSHDPPRLGLGMKQCLEDPFAAKTGALEVGAEVSGRVTRTAPFGAFVDLGSGVEGLIHVSELAHERVNRVESVVREGEVVTVKVVSLDPDRRRIGLSLKQMQATPETGGDFERDEDPELRKLKAQLGAKFGGDLKGGLG